MAIDAQSMPRLRAHVRRRRDEVRGETVLVAPERVIVLDEVADAILRLCDGRRRVREIAAELALQYGEDAQRVQEDVMEFLTELREKNLLAP